MSVELTVRQSAVQLRTSTNTVQLTQAGNQVVAAGVAGPAGSLGYFGAFSSSQTQTVGAGTAVPMMLDTTDDAVGVSIVDGSRVVLSNPGVWNVQFSAQTLKTSGGTGTISIWLAQNGSPVARSCTDVKVQGNNTEEVAAWNWVVRTTGVNEYVQVMWSDTTGDVTLYAVGTRTGPVRPAVPSVILTVTPVLANPH